MAHTEIPYHLILMIGHKQGRSLSLGVVLWEISSGKLPCEGCTQSVEVLKYSNRQQGYHDPPCPGTPKHTLCYIHNAGVKILTIDHYVKKYIAV